MKNHENETQANVAELLKLLLSAPDTNAAVKTAAQIINANMEA